MAVIVARGDRPHRDTAGRRRRYRFETSGPESVASVDLMFSKLSRRGRSSGAPSMPAAYPARSTGPFAGMTAGAFPALVPGTAAALRPPDPLEQLERLALLHQHGALTDAEFDEQKSKLLDEL